MPTYEYKAIEGGCEYCKDGFEVIQGFNDKPLEVCPKCGSPVKRLFTLTTPKKEKYSIYKYEPSRWV